jgi:hypothetical protein
MTRTNADANPLQIASGAQGSGVLATPSRSLWQTDSLGLRMIMEVSWGLRASSGLARIVIVKDDPQSRSLVALQLRQMAAELENVRPPPIN